MAHTTHQAASNDQISTQSRYHPFSDALAALAARKGLELTNLPVVHPCPQDFLGLPVLSRQ